MDLQENLARFLQGLARSKQDYLGKMNLARFLQDSLARFGQTGKIKQDYLGKMNPVKFLDDSWHRSCQVWQNMSWR